MGCKDFSQILSSWPFNFNKTQHLEITNWSNHFQLGRGKNMSERLCIKVHKADNAWPLHEDQSLVLVALLDVMLHLLGQQICHSTSHLLKYFSLDDNPLLDHHYNNQEVRFTILKHSNTLYISLSKSFHCFSTPKSPFLSCLKVPWM